MDIVNSKKIRYQNTILEVLQAAYTEFEFQPNRRELISVDEKKEQFLLIRLGWWNDNYIYEVKMHLELTAEDKVWIHENNTESLLEEEFLKKGILSSDIVLGNVYPSYRAFTDFAAA